MPIAPVEAVPFKVKRDTLSISGDISVHSFLTVRLTRHKLLVCVERGLNSGNNMSFELLERILDVEHISFVTVLFQDLSVQSMIDTTLKDIWIIPSFNTTSLGIQCGSMRSKKFNVLLRGLTS